VRAIEELKDKTDERQHGKEMFARCTAKWLKNILEWVCEERRRYRHASSFIIWI
jgi:hypothetical protein